MAAATTTTTSNNKNIKEVDELKSPSLWLLIWKRLRKNNFAMIALYFISLNILIAIFFPIIIPYDPLSIDPLGERKLGGGANRSPNLRHPTGTDPLGRDSFSFLLAGARTSLLVGFIATSISIIIGVIVGLLAGFYEGITEEILMRITDMFLAVPFLIIALALIQVMFNSPNETLRTMPVIWIIIGVLGLFGWAGTARLVVAQTKQTKQLDYVKAARVLGASNFRIMFSHILPNIMAVIIVITTLSIGGNILSEAGLTFLGVGNPNQTISWGVGVNIGQQRLSLNPEQTLVPGFAIFFIVLATNLLGDALRDATDPRLRE
ncbi:MAG: ABC transporter permease [Candidatus Kariarchaeaceae archaeon]